MTGGIVLCGGRSSRMGRPKAWLPVGNELMLQRVVRVLREVVEPVVVVAAPGQDVPPLDEVVIVRDEVEGRGPLSGLVGGLAALDGKADAAYLSSCDVPFLTAAFVRRVIDQLANFDVAVPHVGGYFHPLAAVYRLSVRPVVAGLLAAGRFRPVFLYDEVPTHVLGPAELADVDPAFRSLRNVNTPEEYAAALAELTS
jgi:molybdopterin-guanine dinucleotide biosynthesis protein A